MPTDKVVMDCIGVDLTAKVKRFMGNGMPYSLLVTVLEEGRDPDADAEVYSRIFYLPFLSLTILSNYSKKVDP